MKNSFEMKFKSLSENESFARVCVSAFCLPLDPTVEELDDIKTVVSEAVTNCIVHAYKGTVGTITLKCEIDGNRLTISVSDNGVGIEDIEKARQPFFTTCAGDERSGMGITVMESFMDEFEISNNKNAGVTVKMSKVFEQQLESVV